uniref:Protein NKG7-like n=1 Tax=Pogona vitticeps TaxID=103695 RepID=A0A6J0UT13_9SAUR
MLFCRIFSLLLASISIAFLLMALITDYWIVAYGPSDISHSGLWQECVNGKCFVPKVIDGYITATRFFLILASVVTLAAVIFLFISFMPFNCGYVGRPFISSIAAFVAGFFTLIAVAVFTSESWGKNKDPQIQVTFEWSFYLGWAAFPLLLLAGIFSLIAHLRSPQSGYESM